MNKDQMKRNHIEQSNILLQKRLEDEKNQSKSKPVEVKSTFKKDSLSDKLMNQLKGKI
jgi:hypothetical protein